MVNNLKCNQTFWKSQSKSITALKQKSSLLNNKNTSGYNLLHIKHTVQIAITTMARYK